MPGPLIVVITNAFGKSQIANLKFQINHKKQIPNKSQDSRIKEISDCKIEMAKNIIGY
jgi:hypothetical protein